MLGYDTAEGYYIGPLDDRDEKNPEYTIEPALSCSNTDFGGEDPATIPTPSSRPETAATFSEERMEQA